jgi:hypothetical protein
MYNQKLPKMKNVLFFFAISFLLVACVKDPFAPDNTTNNSSGTPATPNACPNADAAMWAVKSITKQETVPGVPAFEITIGTGVGFFTSNGLAATTPTRVSVGDAMVNGTTMDYLGETYIATASATQAMGIDWSNGVSWEITGDNGFPAFTHTPTNNFPTVTEVTSADVVNKTSDYILTCNTVTGADSVLFIVGDIYKTLGPTATSCTFTASELSTLDNGTQLVQIVPYTYSSSVFGGKTVCFGKEMVQQLSVTVQ